MKPDIGSESLFLSTPPAFDASVGGPIRNIAITLGALKTRMAWLPDSDKILKICLFVLTEYTIVTKRQTDRQTNTA